jgi:hypothetical protein
VSYASPQKAQKALADFHNAYLHEHQKWVDPGVTEKYTNVFKIEDGWLGYTLNGAYLGFVFECPNRESAQMIINYISRYAVKRESGHGK